MNISGRLLLCLVFLLSSLAGAAWSLPLCASALRSRWGGPALAEQQEGANLQQRIEVHKRRIDAKRKIIRQLRAGAIGLLRAAALFGSLNDAPEDCPDPFRGRWPGSSDGEKLCRQVIAWVKHSRPRTARAEVDLVLERLEKELREHMAANGGHVVLPEV